MRPGLGGCLPRRWYYSDTPLCHDLLSNLGTGMVGMVVVTPRTLRESICHCMGLQYFWVITGIGIVVGGVWLITKPV